MRSWRKEAAAGRCCFHWRWSRGCSPVAFAVSPLAGRAPQCAPGALTGARAAVAAAVALRSVAAVM